MKRQHSLDLIPGHKTEVLMMDIDTRQQVSGNALESRVVRWIMMRVGNPRVLVRMWNGEEFCLADGRPVACLEFRDRRVIPELIMSTSVGFGECYSKGMIEVHGDFVAFADEITRAITEKYRGRYNLQKIHSLLASVRGNTLSRSQQNVQHHYDLGNEFYRLWLDPRMVYTCAYYEHADATLEQAQLAKLDHVCRKLRLRPGQEVIEAGCGWGSLALHMVQHYGVRVKAYNNSIEQVSFAREEAARLGLDSSRLTFVKDDYRNITGRCDAFVSIGMLEHVGRKHYRNLGKLIRNCLKPGGIGLIHSIGRSRPAPVDAWIARHIFPGGHIPSLSEMSEIFEPFEFSILDIENLRLHYARTCRAWLANFERVKDEVSAMYSEEFARAWRLYLAGSSAGFHTGTLQLYQVLIAPPGNNSVPWTRKYQYGESETPGR
ncbi:MAG: cyclopropane-fatty-acyl-phospholipid synthase family protein [Gammaproteobacteria bacterium]|nr:cyclopropane-fatty-acyl-phospholipid synthase family protein [Gammaproteobacteria bacterium]MDH4314269.1 cyclopropane-fatty-acyl-phospholipid synthase family protein [Gammaproteobacteria bacterium]MDH5213654.1 cyclopropane-fatty-acyl-phospholipid synthase family protein [Gammaproteobacteria bacterium]